MLVKIQFGPPEFFAAGRGSCLVMTAGPGLVAVRLNRVAQPFGDAVRLCRAAPAPRSGTRAIPPASRRARAGLCKRGNHARFLGHDDDDRVRLLAQTDRRAMARAERFVQVAPLRQRKNARGVGDAVALQRSRRRRGSRCSGKKSSPAFPASRRNPPDAGLDGFLQLDGLFDGDERADFHLRQTFARLDDDLDAFALFARAGEQRQVSQLGQHAAQFRLKNHQRADGDEHRALPSSQRNTCSFSSVVTSASASSTTTKPMTTGQPRVPRKKRKVK
jgi:hypothetical protein